MCLKTSINDRVRVSEFKTLAGREVYLTVSARPRMNFEESLNDLYDAYTGVLNELNLDLGTGVSLRFHMSDIENQMPALHADTRWNSHMSFNSHVGHLPLCGEKITLHAYHIDAVSQVGRHMPAENILCMDHGEYSSIWVRSHKFDAKGSYLQTQGLFTNLGEKLVKLGGDMAQHLVRTWVYVRDVDTNYKGMVDARREYFKTIGLTSETHYVVSTGIEGRHSKIGSMVEVDSLSIIGLKEGQISYLNASENMCPTYEYNVTFERGSKITFGDRSHYHISGTASIDNHGQVLHIGNTQKQTERVLENLDALLKEGNATFEDMQSIIVYLRDSTDKDIVMDILDSSPLRGKPRIGVVAPICRPEWLVEIEGVAVNGEKNDAFAPYC